MKVLRYSGEFISISGTVWRADILQESDTPFETVGVLDFDTDQPLVLEWGRTDKDEVMCGSTAALKIISPGDRTYEDIYTVEVGRIGLNIYRDGELYWSGTLDPEFYEEPYESARGYTVRLTFSDFGILHRINYDLSGMQTLRNIVRYAINRAGIVTTALDTSHISTTFEDGTAIQGGGLSVRSDNFIDEDGEPSTLYDAVEGILQPLGLRMVQREGKIHVYDLNGLYDTGAPRAIAWDGDSQTMGVDKVANNVTVTFSPYSSAGLISGELEYGGKYDVGRVNLGLTPKPDAEEYGEYFSFLPDYGEPKPGEIPQDTTLVDFTIFTHDKGSGLASIGSRCKYFHMLPVIGGASEDTGVAWSFCNAILGWFDPGRPQWHINDSIPRTGFNFEILTTNRAYLPKLDDTNAAKYWVRVAQEVLIDARYNPLSGSTKGNNEGNDNMVKTRSAFVFIPACVTIYSDAGEALYHYSNKRYAQGGAHTGHLLASKGEWLPGPDPGGDCWLEYYNPDDLREDAGIRGWKGNRHCIGRPDGRGGRQAIGTMYGNFKKMEDGEYMPYPPVAGFLEVRIFAGALGYDYGTKADDAAFGSAQSQWDVSGIYDKLRWCLYKSPVVDVVSNNLVFDITELEDVEYSGVLNVAAKEDITIDTICGTTTQVCPTAKGIYHRTSDGLQIQKLTRAGRTDHPEKLLIGTLYSQYADRKTMLSGEAAIDGGLHYYTEANQGDKRFILLSDVQDVRMNSTEAEYCEFRPDEYDEKK